jgi:hypothetical protein
MALVRVEILDTDEGQAGGAVTGMRRALDVGRGMPERMGPCDLPTSVLTSRGSPP